MAKAIKWQIPFATNDPTNPTQYRIDIYAEGYTGQPIQLLGGPQPFVTEEDKNTDFFTPVRSQTGAIQVCTKLPNGGTLDINDLLPANNIDHPVRLVSISGSTETIEWQGFMSCEAFSQDYTEVPEIFSLPVNSVLEAMKSMEISSYWFDQVSGETISSFIEDILNQVYEEAGMQVATVYSQASDDILSKYIFASQYFTYETNESTGEVTYLYSSTSLCEILEDICRFMGWCLREVSDTFYFERIGSDELGMTTADMADLTWKGTGHQRSMLQGAKAVSVQAALKNFNTYFEMPICPTSGLNEKNAYGGVTAIPAWYYDKCTQTTVGVFTTSNTSKAFLARFYGIRSDSSMPWNVLYEDIGFNNSIYLAGKKYDDSTYAKYCTIKSVQEFSVIQGKSGTIEDVGYLILRIKDETAAKLQVDGYIRCGLKFLGYYYSGNVSQPWNSNSSTSFKVNMEKGNAEIRIPIPKTASTYTFAKSYIELYLYDDFDNTKTSAIISNVSLDYDPPYRKINDNANSNRYAQNLSGYRDEVSVELKLASSFNNRNSLSHIYGVKRYTYGQEYVDYLEPITALTYDLAGGTTATRRPEVDLLNRLATYYGAARQRLELIAAHPTAAPLPLLRLNGIGDGKVYLPLAEARDWKADTCKLTCFETPN